MLQPFIQDIRFGARMLRKNPAFTAVAIAVVALGTGAVSTIFSVANAVVLRGIPGVERSTCRRPRVALGVLPVLSASRRRLTHDVEHGRVAAARAERGHAGKWRE
jgi:hypothetical protein